MKTANGEPAHHKKKTEENTPAGGAGAEGDKTKTEEDKTKTEDKKTDTPDARLMKKSLLKRNRK